ncbi:MAG: CPBP family intramembrane metalloprotease [Acidobacteria bacterium]|nr:CPBP family intramembrane metalloprotease [Acidobacteriota bacterium]
MSASEEPSAHCGCVEQSSKPRNITWDVIELFIGYALILAAIWTPRPLQYWLYFVTLSWFITSIALSFESWKALGCCLAGFWRSSWIVALSFFLAAMAIWVAATLHTLHHPGAPSRWVITFGGYAIWALFQQLLLQGYFLARALRLIPNPNVAALLAASVFALAHLPNPVLTPLTLVWGLTACLVFLRSRNVYPLAIAHAVFGICVAITVPASILHNMRVGLGYLDYEPASIRLSQSHQLFVK